ELALALLAAFGVDALRVGRGRRTAGTAALVLAVLALAVVGATHVSGPAPDLLFGRPDPVSFAQPDTRILLATLAAAAALFTLLARRGLEDRRLLVLTVLFAAGELAYFRSNLLFLSLAPRDAYSDPGPTVAALRAAGGEPRFYGWFVGDVKASALLYERLDL